jgi:hypothetical protein
LAKALTLVTRPKQPTLMRCTLVAEPCDDPDWIFAPKLDGLQVFCWFDGRRLAAHVEDHPLAYADFGGEILEGQHGAGITKGHVLVSWEARGDDVEARD